MTSAIMLLNLKTLLDEDSGTWSDTELYQSLTNGQIETTNLLMAVYRVKKKLPEVLSGLIVDISTTTNSLGDITYPSDFMYFIGALFGVIPIFQIEKNKKYYFREANTYTKSSTNSPTVTLSNKLHFSLQNSVITYSYLKVPTEISIITEPVLLAPTHNAIVIYAYAELLKKVERFQEAINYFNQFIKQVSEL